MLWANTSSGRSIVAVENLPSPLHSRFLSLHQELTLGREKVRIRRDGRKKKKKKSKQTPGQDYLARNGVLYVALTSYEVMFQVTHVANITLMFR